MSLFHYGGRRAAAVSSAITKVSTSCSVRQVFRRQHASRIDVPMPPSSRGSNLQSIEGCPSPTCQCREMPDGLDIDQDQNINGSMVAYSSQILISTGRSDWKSKIETEQTDDGDFVRQLRTFLGPKGKYSDPYHNVLITHSSLPPTEPPTPAPYDQKPATYSPAASAFILPSFQYIPSIPSDQASVEKFIRGFILPTQLHPQHHHTQDVTREQMSALIRHPTLQSHFPGTRKVDEILILVCGHGKRDSRCGTLGPILQAEFEEKLQRQNVALLHSSPVREAEEIDTTVEPYVPTARVGQISHIGGHKWAGNVIIYIPFSWTGHPLAGKGIWYGRVNPANVEGIVSKTVMEGKVIRELFRGGIDGGNGDILRV
ncbi:hypothetical protein K431DRAFT_284282 [Polychaeton citri CBS 116435]|uniref:Altered inheritance of mitochondria protein 32 n=1 Tax=Polychaeton citri CBS 116435 TaxID=1314669 RepID=A0A9P4QBT2_9PEZI|nr:hypothetical protein K431DRAFT_284282 [Polychaeton citri CBS 116435]